jgi:hypothetical protein
VNDYAVLLALLGAALLIQLILAMLAAGRELQAFARSLSMYQPRDPKVQVYGGVHDWEREEEL